ncbi:hypothetical protein L0Y24_10980 [Pectobacterium aroidearum]|nr:hypothetical protein L0Y27_10765 [Pectobacterium aroidearum]UUE72608.1 hypothetical protein L0Y21_11435 [Pectobacterium aroidearum]UUE76996.1 hypothetical protein L0Y20_11540 [Pectobacterium aroidearum]UUE81254.1 hypothetical protein L0Y24_10980 [Pectobacterium aroidearum]
MAELQAGYGQRIEELGEKLRADGSLSGADLQEWAYLHVVTPALEAGRLQAIHNAQAAGGSDEASQFAINTIAQAGAAGAAGAVTRGIGKGGKNPEKSVKNPVRFIEGVTVKDIKTGQVFSGTIDLKPTLDRIASGGAYPHRNDGTVFKNLPDRGTGKIGLPSQPIGYYKEYVHPTPNILGPGPQRIIVGQNGEAYYTNDHYKTFMKIR